MTLLMWVNLIFISIVLIGTFIFLLWNFWTLYQNEKTGEERKEIIDEVFWVINKYKDDKEKCAELLKRNRVLYERKFEAYNNVSYQEHFKARTLLRNPHDLYDPIIWNVKYDMGD